MALETLKIIESGLEYYVLDKVPPQMGKTPDVSGIDLLGLVGTEGFEPSTTSTPC